ncbi:MAG: hypothetical protein RML56_12000 [Burkholderiales bacterium]|nr:hypothetical protein [Burkholderiales bacterium]
MKRIHARRAPELFEGEVLERSDTGRGVAVFSGIRLQHRDEFCHRARRKLGVHDEGERKRTDAAHRRELAHRIERDLGIHRRKRKRSGFGEHQRVAVRRRANERFGRHPARGAGAVFDDERLAERIRKFRCDDARDRVHAAACRVADEHAHLPRRIFLRKRCRRKKRKRRKPESFHRLLPASRGVIFPRRRRARRRGPT